MAINSADLGRSKDGRGFELDRISGVPSTAPDGGSSSASTPPATSRYSEGGQITNEVHPSIQDPFNHQVRDDDAGPNESDDEGDLGTLSQPTYGSLQCGNKPDHVESSRDDATTLGCFTGMVYQKQEQEDTSTDVATGTLTKAAIGDDEDTKAPKKKSWWFSCCGSNDSA